MRPFVLDSGVMPYANREMLAEPVQNRYGIEEFDEKEKRGYFDAPWSPDQHSTVVATILFGWENIYQL